MKAWLKREWMRRKLPSWVAQAERQDAWIILCYHRFEQEAGSDPIPGMSVTERAFRRQLDHLHSLGPIVSLDDGLAGGRGLRFSLTFDDGYRDNLSVLLPILEEANVPATVYCTTGFVSGRLPVLPHDEGLMVDAPALTPSQLTELAGNPLITIGAHSDSHPRLKELTQEQWVEEVDTPRKALQKLTRQSVDHFAYTFGPLHAFDWEEGPSRVEAAGYRTLASNAGGYNVSGEGTTPVHLRRVPAVASASREEFLGWVFRMALTGEGGLR